MARPHQLQTALLNMCLYLCTYVQKYVSTFMIPALCHAIFCMVSPRLMVCSTPSIAMPHTIGFLITFVQSCAPPIPTSTTATSTLKERFQLSIRCTYASKGFKVSTQGVSNWPHKPKTSTIASSINHFPLLDED